MAFCLWKSRETGEIIRIPTLEQWAAAVTNAGQTKYPWGDTYNLQMCNSRDSGWGRRLPVHALPPHDKKYFRIFNLVGNVNEWISPSKMCGGSWQDDCRQDNFASSGFVIGIKNPNKREWRWEGLGFRYVNNCVG